MSNEEFQYMKLILDSMGADIKDIRSNQAKQLERQIEHGEDIAGLQVKAGVWGTIGGIIVSIPAALSVYFKSIS